MAAWLLGAGVMWSFGALFIVAVVPVTLIIIFPTNKRLLAPGRNLASSQTRDLLVKWEQLHAIRSVLSSVASAIYVWQMSGPKPALPPAQENVPERRVHARRWGHLCQVRVDEHYRCFREVSKAHALIALVPTRRTCQMSMTAVPKPKHQ